MTLILTTSTVPSRDWLEFEGGVISELFQVIGPALSRRWDRRKHFSTTRDGTYTANRQLPINRITVELNFRPPSRSGRRVPDPWLARAETIERDAAVVASISLASADKILDRAKTNVPATSATAPYA
jgi:hypothetical protein